MIIGNNNVFEVGSCILSSCVIKPLLVTVMAALYFTPVCLPPVCCVKCINNNTVLSKTKQFRAMDSIDDQWGALRGLYKQPIPGL